MTDSSFVWTDRLVREALGFQPVGEDDRPIRAISTDSRAVSRGDLFIALRGDRFDGHDFIADAVEKGCAGLVVDRAPTLPKDLVRDLLVYRVPDTLVALGDLARFRRHRAQVEVVAVTGSSGKTTVKDLTVAALSGFMNTHGTVGNLNNRIGVPLTILDMSSDAAALVLEMGTNQPGEIAELARVAGPTVAVVTTVSETHVELLGDLAGVMNEKLELVRAMKRDGVVIVGDDPEQLPAAARRIRPDARVSGLSNRSDEALRPLDPTLRPDGTYAFAWQGHEIDLKIPGRHGVYNALLALAVAQALGVPGATAAAGISGVRARALRGEVRSVGGGMTLLLDCYNANPQSVAAALRSLEEREAPGRRVAVLGTMLELGARSGALHQDVLTRALEGKIDRLLVTGAFADAARDHDDRRLTAFHDVDTLAADVAGHLTPDDTVLLKASRGVRLERVVPAIEAAFGEGAD